VDQQSHEDGIPFVRMDEFVLVRFFAEMKVGRNGMLEKVNDQVAEQHQEGRVSAAELEALGHDFDERRGEHESGAECDKVLEVSTLPISLNDDGAAKHVGAGSGQAEQDAREDRVHFARR
jgi:hypothetical protein